MSNHAKSIFLTVHNCKSLIHHVATVHHATPDVNTCVVLTGNQAYVDTAIVNAATNSDVSHCAYVILCFQIPSHIVLAILSHQIIDQIQITAALVAITQNGIRQTKNAAGRNVTNKAIITHTPFCQSFDPCAKLTAEHAKIINDLVRSDGGSCSGFLNKRLLR